MNLLDKVLTFVKSAGHSIEGAEHALLNDFAAYLGSDKVVSGFSSDPVVAQFAATLVPAPEPVQVAPEAPLTEIVEQVTAVVEAPVEQVTAVVEAPVEQVTEVQPEAIPEQESEVSEVPSGE